MAMSFKGGRVRLEWRIDGAVEMTQCGTLSVAMKNFLFLDGKRLTRPGHNVRLAKQVAAPVLDANADAAVNLYFPDRLSCSIALPDAYEAAKLQSDCAQIYESEKLSLGQRRLGVPTAVAPLRPAADARAYAVSEAMAFAQRADTQKICTSLELESAMWWCEVCENDVHGAACSCGAFAILCTHCGSAKPSHHPYCGQCGRRQDRDGPESEFSEDSCIDTESESSLDGRNSDSDSDIDSVSHCSSLEALDVQNTTTCRMAKPIEAFFAPAEVRTAAAIGELALMMSETTSPGTLTAAVETATHEATAEGASPDAFGTAALEVACDEARPAAAEATAAQTAARKFEFAAAAAPVATETSAAATVEGAAPSVAVEAAAPAAAGVLTPATTESAAPEAAAEAAAPAAAECAASIGHDGEAKCQVQYFDISDRDDFEQPYNSEPCPIMPGVPQEPPLREGDSILSLGCLVAFGVLIAVALTKCVIAASGYGHMRIDTIDGYGVNIDGIAQDRFIGELVAYEDKWLGFRWQALGSDSELGMTQLDTERLHAMGTLDESTGNSTLDNLPDGYKHSVEGYPTIKNGDYAGSCGLTALEKFAEENSGPICSSADMDLCNGVTKKKIDGFRSRASEIERAMTEDGSENGKLQLDTEGVCAGGCGFTALEESTEENLGPIHGRSFEGEPKHMGGLTRLECQHDPG